MVSSLSMMSLFIELAFEIWDNVVPVIFHDRLDVWAFAAEFFGSIGVWVNMAFWEYDILADFCDCGFHFDLLFNFDDSKEFGIEVDWDRSEGCHSRHGDRCRDIDQTGQGSSVDCGLDVTVILWETESICCLFGCVCMDVQGSHVFSELFAECSREIRVLVVESECGFDAHYFAFHLGVFIFIILIRRIRKIKPF